MTGRQCLYEAHQEVCEPAFCSRQQYLFQEESLEGRQPSALGTLYAVHTLML